MILDKQAHSPRTGRFVIQARYASYGDKQNIDDWVVCALAGRPGLVDENELASKLCKLYWQPTARFADGGSFLTLIAALFLNDANQGIDYLDQW